jgi:serralysin
VRLWSGEGLSGEALGDVLTEIENLRGSEFSDTLVGDNGVNEISGGAGADALWAGDGDDVLMGGAGADQLQGQGGRDTASYAEAGGGVFVRLWSGEGLSGEALGDVLTEIENLRGSGFSRHAGGRQRRERDIRWCEGPMRSGPGTGMMC